jgi:hypothetical protein
MEIKIAHKLTSDELTRRLAAAANHHGIDFTPDSSGMAGTLAKDTGFLGTVRARYSIEHEQLSVLVSEKPAFLPEEMLRRMLEDELKKLVSL